MILVFFVVAAVAQAAQFNCSAWQRLGASSALYADCASVFFFSFYNQRSAAVVARLSVVVR